MPRAERQYVRVYHDDLLRDYKHVWTDDTALAAFVRLLSVADKMWPAAPELPRSVSRRALGVLNQPNEKGNRLVEILPPHCYRIRGHDAERKKRQDSARKGSAVRWDSDRNADASADAMPRRDETRRDENLPPPPAERGRRKNGTNPRASGAAPRQTGSSPRQNGSSPRQEREALKTGPTRLGDILARAAEAGRPEKVPA